MSRISHSEIDMLNRIGPLKAAVLGANDGLVPTSILVGVGAPGSARPEVLIAGLAGLVAGAMSMAAGESASVSSPTDVERADLARESRELKTPAAELAELTWIGVDRGRDLAEKAAVQLTQRDALGSQARDELGISETLTALAIQAAWVSALAFAVGAVLPLIVVLLALEMRIAHLVAASSIIGHAIPGGLGASAGGAGVGRGAAGVMFWGRLQWSRQPLPSRCLGSAPGGSAGVSGCRREHRANWRSGGR